MKGVILAGGNGTRLSPITLGISKQLVPIFDKPMIFYPLSTLISLSISDIAVITRPGDKESFKSLLGDGSAWGARITYLEQNTPNGLGEAPIIAEEFLDGESFCLILGDNLFYGIPFGEYLTNFRSGAMAFGIQVSNPEHYGVVVLQDGHPTRLIEKPKFPVSNIALPGIYFFDGSAPARARLLRPSGRGELEITDLLASYIQESTLQIQIMNRGSVWLDTGTVEALNEASEFVRVIQRRQGQLIGSPEIAAFESGLINLAQLRAAAMRYGNSMYGSVVGKWGEK